MIMTGQNKWQLLWHHPLPDDTQQSDEGSQRDWAVACLLYCDEQCTIYPGFIASHHTEYKCTDVNTEKFVYLKWCSGAYAGVISFAPKLCVSSA